MNTNFLLRLAFLLFTKILISYSIFNQKKIDSIISKVTKKVDNEYFELMDIYKKNINYEETEPPQTIIYDPKKISKIIEELEVPENFNYLDSSGCKIIIKDQQSCGCCWSMAATTSLAYRYFKYGIDINLSPQDGLSCYVKDCDYGNYLIDSAMNLVKNGSVTEQCLPFSSGSGLFVEPCPTSCKDRSEYKKYYAKELYLTEDFYSEENFYDIVTIMIYQLVNHGPIVTGIQIFEDFIDWSDYSYKEKCKNEVYSYDGKSEYLGGHAVTITGYGKINSKYYWLLQNSWGTETCDEGFIKIEMGQIGVENVAFTKPYIPKQSQKITDIYVRPELFDESCNLKVKTKNLSKEWTDILELSFTNEKSSIKRAFNYQCSMVDLPKGKEPACFFEWLNWEFMDKGEYVFSSSKALGVDNFFSVSEDFNNFRFNFYGGNLIYYLEEQVLYVSGEGSSILLYHDYFYGKESNLPPIFANEKSSIELSNCQPFNYRDYTLVHCILQKGESDYFDSMTKPSYLPVVYLTLCGAKESTEVIVMNLDQTQYPVFYAMRFLVPENGVILSDSVFSIIFNIKGSLLGKILKNTFSVFIYLETEGKNTTLLSDCNLGVPKNIGKEFESECITIIREGKSIKFDELYLSQLYFPYESNSPYDLVIPKVIKGEKKTSPFPSFSKKK